VPAGCVDAAVVVKDAAELEAVALARGEVIGVVGRGDLDRSGPESHVDELGVGDDWDEAVVERVADVGACFRFLKFIFVFEGGKNETFSPCSSLLLSSFSPEPKNLSLLPIKCLYRGSSGCTATAESPIIVSGLVVATTISVISPSVTSFPSSNTRG
jgi:hypothetical protein